MNTVNNNFSIFKTDSDKRLVFGWASISITVNGEQLEDRQKDIIDPEDLEEAAYEYVLNFRDTGEEHNPTMRKKGKLVESCVLTAEKQKAMGIPEGSVPVGWWIGFKIEDDAAWERVKNGQYRMFSIEGKANREPVEKSGGPTGCGVLVVRNGKVLTGTRIERASHGQICGPGGHIEAGETPEQAAVREAHEEFGITCHDLKPLGTTPDGKSAIFMCSSFSGTPKTDEEEMTDIQWIAPEEIEEADAFRPFWESLRLLPVEKSRSSYDEYPSYSMWLEENLDATIEQQKAAKEYYQAHKDDAERDWKWNPDRKDKPVAKTFADVLKFNQNHDRLGRFASAGGGSAPGASERPFKKPTEEDVKRLQAEMGPVDLSGANYFGTTGFRAVNEALRNNNPLDEKSQKTVDALDKNMKPSPADLSLDRFMFGGMFEALGLNAKVIESGDEAEASKAVGKILENKGYTSTTYDAEQIPFPVLPGKTILMHINVPKGTNLLIRPDLKEAEILLARDTSVKINGVKKGSLGEWEVNCEVVPNAIGKSFDEVLKFNPYHDGKGRFASANSATSFTWRPGASKMHDKAIAGEKDRTHRSDFHDKIKGLIVTSYTYNPKEMPQMLIGIGKEVAKEIDSRFKAKKKAGETTEDEPQTEDIYDVLRDVRSFGPGEYANKVFNSSDLDDKRTKAIMDDALGRYPTDWYADAIYDCGIDIRDKAGRAAHYIGYDSTSQIKVYAKESPELVKQLDLKSDSISNLGIANELAHELGHYFERSNNDVGNAARAYYEKRTKNSELTEMYPGEYTKKDHFADEYMGKYYTSGSTEITSMLVQKLGYLDPKKSITQDFFSNQKKDVQSYNFILGLLAGGGTKWEE